MSAKIQLFSAARMRQWDDQCFRKIVRKVLWSGKGASPATWPPLWMCCEPGAHNASGTEARSKGTKRLTLALWTPVVNTLGNNYQMMVLGMPEKWCLKCAYQRFLSCK